MKVVGLLALAISPYSRTCFTKPFVGVINAVFGKGYVCTKAFALSIFFAFI